MVLAISPIAEAPPSLPYIMYGEITINGIAAPIGTIVEVWFGDSIRESSTTVEKGFYGTPVGNRLLINGVSGETYTFRAKSPVMDSYGTTAQTSTFQSGVVDDIALHFIWDGIIEPDNTAPVADNIYIDVDEDNSVLITLIASDTDGDDLTYTVLTNPAHGTLTGTAPSLAYIPDQDYNGADTFTYRADDGTDGSNTATVYISITPVNDIPIASDISAVTSEDTAKVIALDASDADDNPLTYSIVSVPSHGTVSLSSSIATYTPNTDYYGGDTFTYKVNDGTADSNIATVTVDVTFVNQAPVISDMPGISLEADSIIITAWTLDSFVDDETSDSSIIWTSAVHDYLSITVNLDRTLTLESSSDFSENTTLALTASDGELSDNGVLSITFISAEDNDSDTPPPMPVLPSLFYGAVRIDYIPAPIGTSIVAKIDDETRGTFVTTVSGLYGDHPANRLIVNGVSGDNGKTINFYIDGNLADETGIWESGKILELDLTTNPNPNDPPVLPAFYYGAVRIDYIPAPIGTSIVAKIDDETRGTFVTTVSGLYGDHPANRLMVEGSSEDTGKTVSFYIDGNLAEQTVTWNSGDVLELDLTTNPNPNDPPVLPAFYYGAVRIDYIPAPIGTSIVAKIDDETRGTFVTTVSGLYGDHPANRLIVEGSSEDTGKTVSFYIDGNLAEQTVTWNSGDVLELDLTISPNPNDSLALSHLLYGEITINGTLAPAGTLIEAWSNGTLCGNMTTTEVGIYGTPAGNRLIVTGVDDANITFRAKGSDMDAYALSNQTIIFNSGIVENLTLDFVSEIIVLPPVDPPAPRRSSGGGSSSSFVIVDPILNVSNQSNSTMNISMENSTQNISDQINLSDDDSGLRDDTTHKPSDISSGDDLGSEGGSLFDTASSVDSGNSQDTGFITGLFLRESAPSPYVTGLVIVILILTLGYIIFLK